MPVLSLLTKEESEELKTALIYSVEKGYDYLAKELLKKGADIEIVDLYGRNALMEASFFQKKWIANLILEQAKKQKIEIEISY